MPPQFSLRPKPEQQAIWLIRKRSALARWLLLTRAPYPNVSAPHFRERRCLPASDLISAHVGCRGERNVLWLFGTLDVLTGEDNGWSWVMTASGRDLSAGCCYLAGQRQRCGYSTMLFRPSQAEGPGQERGLLRTTIFTQPVREEAWLVHPNELDAVAAGPMILAPDAYTAIIRFTRQVAAGGQGIRVGWNLHTGGTKR